MKWVDVYPSEWQLKEHPILHAWIRFRILLAGLAWYTRHTDPLVGASPNGFIESYIWLHSRYDVKDQKDDNCFSLAV